MHGPLTRYVKFGVAHAPGMPGTFSRHRLQMKPLVSDPGMHPGTCVTHVPWCMSRSLTRGGGENIPVIPGACATCNFTYLARGPWPCFDYCIENIYFTQCNDLLKYMLSASILTKEIILTNPHAEYSCISALNYTYVYFTNICDYVFSYIYKIRINKHKLNLTHILSQIHMHRCLRDLIAATCLVILLKIGFKSSIFRSMWPSNLMDDLEKH